jgi:predicted RNase H-like HicB family nuclease
MSVSDVEELIATLTILYLSVSGLALKLKDVKTEIIQEDDGTYAVACSALGVYSVGRTLSEAKRNFHQALDLHLAVLREKATKELTVAAH